jgi:hypothetical protein
MCPLANILVLLTHHTADSNSGHFQGLSWPNPITALLPSKTITQHPFSCAWPMVISIYPATGPVHVYSNCYLIDPNNLPGQPVTSHIFPTSFWSDSFLSFFLDILILEDRTNTQSWNIDDKPAHVAQDPGGVKIPSLLILYAALLYHISLHHGLIWP